MNDYFLSMSYLSAMATKTPGMTMSPSPNILKVGGTAAISMGKSNLMGASMFLATVTMTSVPKTQKIS